MSEVHVKPESPKHDADVAQPKRKPADKPAWVTPRLEDVSEQVMAQPYIRFT